MSTRTRIDRGNLFANLPQQPADEIFESLAGSPAVRIERIVSTGQATPAKQWYDQQRDEWVALIRGAAGLRFEDNPEMVELKPGDYLKIPAHCRHRVEWTDPEQVTIWIAVHY